MNKPVQIQSWMLAIPLILMTLGTGTLKLIVFKAFQDQITESFCVNKEKPELECGGKCHLNEVIVEQEETESTPPLPECFKESDILELLNEEKHGFDILCGISETLKRLLPAQSRLLDRIPDDLPSPPPKLA